MPEFNKFFTFGFTEDPIPQFTKLARHECAKCGWRTPVPLPLLNYEELFNRQAEATRDLADAFNRFIDEMRQEIPAVNYYLDRKKAEFMQEISTLRMLLENGYIKGSGHD